MPDSPRRNAPHSALHTLTRVRAHVLPAPFFFLFWRAHCSVEHRSWQRGGSTTDEGLESVQLVEKNENEVFPVPVFKSVVLAFK